MPFINKSLEEINESDLQHLIDAEIIEKKILDYKSELPRNTDKSKKKFLAAVSSFANASGGDIIYGITENREIGKPETLTGIEMENIDKEILRLEQIIRDGLEPNIPSSSSDIHPIFLKNSKYALIIRLGKSWLAPHRISFKKWDRFYSRSTNGKYRLDVPELKSAFILSESIGDKIKGFREIRISNIHANELPIPFYRSPKIALHLIPLTSFNPGQTYDLEISLYDIQPMLSSRFDHRYNIDGLLTYSKFQDDDRSFSYVQLFRNGIIEAVNSKILWSGIGKKVIPITEIEEALIEYIPRYMNVYNKLNIDAPIFLFATLIDVKDYSITKKQSWISSRPYPIDRDIVLIPEIIIEKKKFDLIKGLKPLFDSMWNACGYKSSFNYNSEGERVR